MKSERIDSWFAGRPIPGVLFRLNDSVRIVHGDAAGQAGSIISLVQLEPDVRFLVETGAGADIVLPQSELEALADD